MATHRRTLASPMDNATHQKHPTTTTSSSSADKPHRMHHQEYPFTATNNKTIQSISNQFSRLYTNHKILTSLKASNVDSSCTTTLTKSKSQHATRQHHQRHQPTIPSYETTIKEVKEKVVKQKPINDDDFEKEKYEIKKPISSSSISSKKEWKIMDSHENNNNKKHHYIHIRRGSFGSSQKELSNFFSKNGVKVMSVDMPPLMQIHAVDCARKAYDSLEKFSAKSLAQTLKKEFDGAYGPAWHCIVGKSFGSFVTHSVGGFMYLSIDDKLYVLLFKTTVQKVVGE